VVANELHGAEHIGHAHAQERLAHEKCIIGDILFYADERIRVIMTGNPEFRTAPPDAARIDDRDSKTSSNRSIKEFSLVAPVFRIIAVDAKDDCFIETRARGNFGDLWGR
jgi:hypothetical protein